MTTKESDRSPLLLLDTHTLLWMFENPKRLGIVAWENLKRAARKNCIVISAITPWEIGLLVSKKRIDIRLDVVEWINEALAMPGATLIGLDPEIAVASTHLPFEMHSDPADRILVATARRLGATLVTADRALLDLAAQGQFKAQDATQ